MDEDDDATHYRMSRVKAKDTAPEVALRRMLWAQGARYRIHDGTVVGRPDISSKRARVAVFIDGCFWHRCPRHYKAPASNADFWRQKVEYNHSRRQQVLADLGAAGWRAVQVWECDVRERPAASLRRVSVALAAGARNGGRWPRKRPAGSLVRVPPPRFESPRASRPRRAALADR